MFSLEKLNQLLTGLKPYLIILGVGFIAYFNSLFNGFVWDDEEQIVLNPIIKSFAYLSEIVSGATFQSGGAGLTGYFFRPFLTLWFMINHAIWGLHPFGFHLLQLLFHLINGLLVFKLIKKLFELTEFKYRNIVATLLALVFVVHPAINEGVVYISAVNDLMYTFLLLVSFNLILNWSKKGVSIKKLVILALLLLSALFFKEPAIVGILIILALSFIFKLKIPKSVYLTLFITFLSYLFIRFILVQTPLVHPMYAPISEATLGQRLMTVPSVLLYYLRSIFYPDNLAISIHFVTYNFSVNQFLLPFIFCLGLFLTTLFIAYKSQNKLIILGIVWIVLGLGPVSNIYPLDMTVASRWLYFPFVGFLILFAGLLQVLSKNKISLFVAVLLIICLYIPPLFVRNIVRNSDWKNGLTLYSHDLKIMGDSFDLENNLGVELVRANRYEEAKGHFLRSIELQPKWHFTQNNLGAVYEHEGDYAKAKQQYLKVLESGDYYLAHENLANLLLFHESTESAKIAAENSLKKLPNNSRLWLILAIAQYQLGDKEQALISAKNSYYLQPSQEAYYMVSRLSQNLPIEFN